MRIVSRLLIVVGIVLIGLSTYSIHKWRFVQSESLTLPSKPIVTEKAPKQEVIMEKNEPEEMDPLNISIYRGSLSREEYQNGQMTIRIPRLDIAANVMDGTTGKLLKEGPGLYENSPLHNVDNPNICIAAHRTTYGAWFKHVDELEKQDIIILDYSELSFVYEVQDVFVVENNDWTVTEPQGYSAVTLTTCHPMYTAKQRLVVRGKLIKINEMNGFETEISKAQ